VIQTVAKLQHSPAAYIGHTTDGSSTAQNIKIQQQKYNKNYAEVKRQ